MTNPKDSLEERRARFNKILDQMQDLMKDGPVKLAGFDGLGSQERQIRRRKREVRKAIEDEIARKPRTNYNRQMYGDLDEVRNLSFSYREVMASAVRKGVDPYTVLSVLNDVRLSQATRTDKPATVVRPETNKVALPDIAPAIWKTNKKRGQTPPDFIREHYSDYLGRGLARADLLTLDPSLYKALTNWLSNPKHEMPSDVVLPTTRDIGDAWVDRIERGGLSEVTDSKVLSRLARRMDRQQTHQK